MTRLRTLAASLEDQAGALLDRADQHRGLMEALICIGLGAAGLWWAAGHLAPVWLIILAAVWPGRMAGRLWTWAADRLRHREAAHRPQPRTLAEATLMPPPATEVSPPTTPTPRFAPRRPK